MAVVSIQEATSSSDCRTPGCMGESDPSGLCSSCRQLARNGTPQVRFEATGLVVDGELDDDELRALLRRIARMDGALKWWLGDLIAHFDRRFWKQDPVWLAILDELGISYQHARECLVVARAVPLVSRRERLSWSHHRAVAQLPPEEQEHWLGRAEREGLSVSRLKSDLRSVALAERGEPVVDFEQTQLRLVAPAESIARWRAAAAERGCTFGQLVVEALDALTCEPQPQIETASRLQTRLQAPSASPPETTETRRFQRVS